MANIQDLMKIPPDWKVPLKDIYDGDVEDRLSGERITNVIWNNTIQTLRTHINWILPYLTEKLSIVGEWDITKDYNINDVVFSEEDGGSFVAIQNIDASEDPPIDIHNTDYWMSFSAPGKPGEPGPAGPPGAAGPPGPPGPTYELPIATSAILGGIKPDNDTILVDEETGEASAIGMKYAVITTETIDEIVI